MEPILFWIAFVGFIAIIAFLYGYRERRRQPKHPPTNNVSFTHGPGDSQVGEPSEESPDKDSWEGSFWEATDPIPVEVPLRIDYTDANGTRTERVVDVRKYDGGLHGGMIIGLCRLRHATRTFRTDRINQCVVEGTGEVVEDVEDVGAFLRSLYEKSVHASTDNLLEEDYQYLRVLLFVGKADGRLAKNEVAVIADACRDLSGDERITVALVQKMLKDMDVPTLHAFRMAVGKMISFPEKKRMAAIQQAERIIATQKTVHPAEQEAIEYMRQRLT